MDLVYASGQITACWDQPFPHLIHVPFVSISTIGIVLDSPHEEDSRCCTLGPRVRRSSFRCDDPPSPPPSSPSPQGLVRPGHRPTVAAGFAHESRTIGPCCVGQSGHFRLPLASPNLRSAFHPGSPLIRPNVSQSASFRIARDPDTERAKRGSPSTPNLLVLQQPQSAAAKKVIEGLSTNRSHAESSGEFCVAQGFDRLSSRRKFDDSRTA